jgi:hypothetical protein
MREEAAEKKRDEHFNTIRPEIPTRQERRVKEKTDVLAPTAFDDNMDLLDNVESLLIKDGSLWPTSMDINTVFTLLVEFRGCQGGGHSDVSCPKETIFEKLKASRQYLMSLYVRCHIDGKPISRMLVDGGTAISLMSYSIFKKLEREDDELGKTNLMLNGVGETRWKPALSSAWSSL